MKTFDLRNYVITFPGVIPQDRCEDITNKLNQASWKKHSYHNTATNETMSYDDDLYISYLDQHQEDVDYIMATIYNILHSYYRHLDLEFFNSWAGYSKVRFNKYSIETRMRKHFDGIKTIFDGNVRGDPTLS